MEEGSGGIMADLVFHGGSGSSAEEIAEAVSYGVILSVRHEKVGEHV